MTRKAMLSLSDFRLAVLLACSSLVWGLHNQYISNHAQRVQNLELSTLGANLRSSVDVNGRTRPPVLDYTGNPIPPYDTIYTFDQLIDHKNPSLGTFKQRYYHSWEYYRPGGPIILLTPGEVQLDTPGREFFVTNTTIPGAITQSVKGAAVILEHRFYGESNPYPNSTVESFRVHTLDQAIDDFAYFAKNAKLEMPGGNAEAIRPHRTPWIFVGGSYSGAIAAWIVEQKPNEFWASYSTSGVVQPQLDFHEYYHPIERYMPANCSADVHAIIEHVDAILDTRDKTLIDGLLNKFGLPGFSPADFAYALAFLLDWQSLNVDSSARSSFYQFCDSMEVQGNSIADRDGWGLEIALDSLANYVSGPDGFWERFCEGTPSLYYCLSFDGSVIANQTDVNNWWRSWAWTVCNEVGWWQVGPVNGGGIVSKYYNLATGAKFCVDAFPGAFPDPSIAAYEARIQRTTAKYKGWRTFHPRVVIVNGKHDPWLDVTLSATTLPMTGSGAPINDKNLRPIFLTDGYHVSDVRASNAAIDPTIANVWEESLQAFPRWVSQFVPSPVPPRTPT